MEFPKVEHDDLLGMDRHPRLDLSKRLGDLAEAPVDALVGVLAVPGFEAVAPADGRGVDDIEVEEAEAEVQLLGDGEVVVLEGAVEGETL